MDRLNTWRQRTGLRRMFVTHLFDQEAFMVDLDRLIAFRALFQQCTDREKVDLQRETGIFFSEQVYSRIDAEGAAERKWVYRVHPSTSVKIGIVTAVDIGAELALSPSKKYVSNVVFRNGNLSLSKDFFDAIMTD